MAKSKTADTDNVVEISPVDGYKPVIVRYRLTGIPPGLLMHNGESFLDEGASNGSMTATKQSTDDQDAAAARRAAYILPSGQLYILAVAVSSALVEGGAYSKVGKTRYSAKSVLGQMVFPLDDRCPLFHPKTKKPITEWRIDIRGAVNQTTGGRVRAVRANVPEWMAEISFSIEHPLVSDQLVTEALTVAGRIVGIGAFKPRPKRSKIGGPFGRFTVERIL